MRFELLEGDLFGFLFECGVFPPPPPAPAPAPPCPPAPPVDSCAGWAGARGYTCAAHHCLSDGDKVSGHCGAGLCWNCPNGSTGACLPTNGTSARLCAPLGGACQTNHSRCSEAAAARCDAEPRCHAFALYKSGDGSTDTRAQFFEKGVAGLTVQKDWSAFTKQ